MFQHLCITVESDNPEKLLCQSNQALNIISNEITGKRYLTPLIRSRSLSPFRQSYFEISAPRRVTGLRTLHTRYPVSVDRELVTYCEPLAVSSQISKAGDLFIIPKLDSYDGYRRNHLLRHEYEPLRIRRYNTTYPIIRRMWLPNCTANELDLPYSSFADIRRRLRNISFDIEASKKRRNDYLPDYKYHTSPINHSYSKTPYNSATVNKLPTDLKTSEIRGRLRQLICKSKNNPHYYNY